MRLAIRRHESENDILLAAKLEINEEQWEIEMKCA